VQDVRLAILVSLAGVTDHGDFDRSLIIALSASFIALTI
jgi:hypothetical protein